MRRQSAAPASARSTVALLMVALLAGSAPFAAAAPKLTSTPTPPVDLFAGVAWSAFPTAASPIADHEATGGRADPTHGPAHGVNAAAIDLASAASRLANPGGANTVASAVSDPTHLFLQMRLGGSPLHPGSSGALYQSYHWDFLLDVDGDGMSEFVVDLFGGDRAATPASPRYKDGSVAVYNNHACEDLPTGNVLADNAIAPAQLVWSAPADRTSNAYTRVVPAGSQAWLSFAIPWSALTYARGACASQRALDPGDAFGLFASTSASNTDPLQKDWMAGAVLAPALTLAKRTDATQVASGDLVTFTLTLTNEGSGAAPAPVVRDPLPSHTSFVSADAGGVYDATTGAVTWTLPPLQPGASTSMSVTVLVESLPAAIQSVANLAFAGDVASNAVVLPVARAPAPTLGVAAGPSTIAPGSSFVVTVPVANAGDATLQDAVVTVTLSGPAAFSPVAGCDLVSATVVTCTLGELAPGESRILVFDATALNGLDAGTHVVTATAQLAHAGGAIESGPATIQVVASALLGLVETAAPDTLTPGETARFTFTYANAGDGTATDAVLSWTPPAGVVIVAISDGGVLGSDGVVRWDLADLPAGSGGAAWVDVALAPDAPGGRTLVVDDARIEAANAAPAQSSTTLVLELLAALTVEATATPDSTGPGGAIAYVVRYANVGDAAAHAATVRLLLDGPATLTSATGGSIVDGVATWTLGEIPRGASGTLDAVATASGSLPTGAHLVRAVPTITASDAADATGAPAVVTIHAGAVLALAARAEPASASPGDLVTWRIAWANLGNGTTPDATLVDRPAAGIEIVEASEGASLDAGAIVWQLGALPAGAQGVVSWAGRLPAVMSQGETPIADDAILTAGALAPATAAATTLVTASPALDVVVLADRAATGPGGVIAYTISFANVGDAHARDAVLRLAVEGPATVETSEWPLGDILAGASGSIVAPAHVADVLAHGDHLVRATATLGAAGVDDAASLPADVNVVARARLALVDEVAPLTARPSDRATWTLSYANLGNATAKGARLDATIPAPLVDAASVDGAIGAGSVSWALGDLPAGALGAVQWSAQVPFPMPAGRTFLTDEASFAAIGVPATTARATLAVDAAPALRVGLAVDKARAEAGERLTYTLTVANVGDADATGVSLSDVIPALVAFESASHGGGYDASTGAARWVVGALPAGASSTVRLVVRVAGVLPDVDTPVVDRASATSAEGATGTSPDVVTLVRGTPDLLLTKSADDAEATEGGSIVYTITVTNVGTADARGVLLVDELPVAHAFVSADHPDAVWDGHAVRLPIPVLVAAGGTETLRITTSITDVTVPVLSTCNVVVATGLNVVTRFAQACVDLRCELPRALVSNASAKALPLGIPLASVSQAGEGSSERSATTGRIGLLADEILLENATARATVGQARSHARTTFVVGAFDLLDGRITGSGMIGAAEASIDGEVGAWNADGSRFVDLVIDGVRYDDVSPNTIVPLGFGVYVALKEVRGSSSAPTQGPGGDPARRASVELTMLRIIVAPSLVTPSPGELRVPDVRIGAADAYAVLGVAPECEPVAQGPRALAEATAVRSVKSVRVDGARVEGVAGGEVAHGVSVMPAPLQGDVHALRTYARTDVTATAAEALGEVHVGRVVLLGGLVTADDLYARVSSTLDGPVVEEVRWTNLVVAGQRQSDSMPPNTRLVAGLGTIVLNEQIVEPDGTFRLTLVRIVEDAVGVHVGQVRVGVYE